MLRFIVFYCCVVLSVCQLDNPFNCTRPNEHFECGSACQTECDTLGQICLIVDVGCNDACYCDPGFARDSSGTCIPISQCRRS